MNLSEKILALRTQLGLSQGELAEKLEVSRQSVSKWETAQSVPELDKLIRLADLFGVSVDELVREGKPPRPEAETGGAEPEPKLVYVERKGLRPAQILGIVLTAGGMVMMLAMLFNASLFFIGAAVLILGLPLLLAKRHPYLIQGWTALALGYLTLCNPYLSGAGWSPLAGLLETWRLIRSPDGPRGPAVWLLFLAYLGLSALTAALPVLTARLAWRRRKGRTEAGQDLP